MGIRKAFGSDGEAIPLVDPDDLKVIDDAEDEILLNVVEGIFLAGVVGDDETSQTSDFGIVDESSCPKVNPFNFCDPLSTFFALLE
jgi:hypothetical protein